MSEFELRGRLGFSVLLIFCLLFEKSYAHHDGEPWRAYHHGIIRAFFGGFFSTLLFIVGALVFYHYCLRGGSTSVGRLFPAFPRKPLIPVTLPFARAPNFLDPDRPETIVLTASSTPPSVFYSNAPNPSNIGPVKSGYASYNVL